MANRRILKKSVKQVCNDLFADCVFLHVTNQCDRAVLERLMQDIVDLDREVVARINHTAKGSERLFYKKLRTEFTGKVNQLVDAISQA